MIQGGVRLALPHPITDETPTLILLLLLISTHTTCHAGPFVLPATLVLQKHWRRQLAYREVAHRREEVQRAREQAALAAAREQVRVGVCGGVWVCGCVLECGRPLRGGPGLAAGAAVLQACGTCRPCFVPLLHLGTPALERVA